jgi:basic membrane protein A
MMKRVDVGVEAAVERALDYYAGKIDRYGGILELGLAEGGISVSTLEDLDTFLQIAIQAGRQVNRDEIYNKVRAMRESIPSWIWEEVNKLAELLNTNPAGVSVYGLTFKDIADKVPYTAETIGQVRNTLKVGVETATTPTTPVGTETTPTQQVYTLYIVLGVVVLIVIIAAVVFTTKRKK